MPFVSAGLGDHIDDGTAGTAELSRKAVLIHLKFLDRLYRKLVWRARTGAAERLAEESVVVVGAVDLQAVESSLLSSNRQVACARWFAHHSRRQGREVEKVATVDRQVFNCALVDDRGNRSTRRLNDLTLR